MAVIAIDVDLTILRDIGQDWLDWLNKESGKSLTLEDCQYDYNLGKFFPALDDPYDFWRAHDLYDNKIPSDDALRIVPKLCREHDVIFASAIKGDHHKSKYRMLKRWFPKMKGFLATKEKNFVRCDAFVDDRNKFLNQQGYDVIKIKMDTPFKQTTPLTNPVTVVKDWYEAYDVLKGLDY